VASIKRRADVIRVRLAPEERMVLAGFAREVAQLLGGVPAADPDPLAAMVGMTAEPGPDSAGPQVPDDPALLRLLPDAYDDPAGAAEFRRLTDDELRRGKATALSRLADDVEHTRETIELDDEAADIWAQAINDVRLVLGVRLGIEADGSAWRRAIPAGDPRAPLASAYSWLTGLQELLLDAIVLPPAPG
jgi:hypothetical protein